MMNFCSNLVRVKDAPPELKHFYVGLERPRDEAIAFGIHPIEVETISALEW